MKEIYSEAVEVCPWCMHENVIPNYDTEKSGYITVCQDCGREIFICDECKHADDNPSGFCDWQEIAKGETLTGRCFRGTTHNLKEEQE